MGIENSMDNKGLLTKTPEEQLDDLVYWFKSSSYYYNDDVPEQITKENVNTHIICLVPDFSMPTTFLQYAIVYEDHSLARLLVEMGAKRGYCDIKVAKDEEMKEILKKAKPNYYETNEEFE